MIHFAILKSVLHLKYWHSLKKPITVFGITKQAIRSEDGLSIFPDDTIDNLDLDAYDSLILPGQWILEKLLKMKE